MSLGRSQRRPWYAQLSLPGVMISGALGGLGQEPFSLIPAALLGFAVLSGIVAAAGRPLRAAVLAWAGGLGYFVVSLYWIVEPFQVDAARHGALAPVALILLSAGLSLFWGLAGWVSRLAARPAARAFAFAGALALAELARGYVLTGFPWALPAYLWAETDAIGIAGVTGPFGLTLLTLGLAALAASAALGGRPALILVAAAGSAALVPIGAALLPAPSDLSDRPVVRLVQPNVPQRDKWDPGRAMEFLDRKLSYTSGPTAGGGPLHPDLIVWPETAIPWILDRAGSVIDAVSDAAGPAAVVLGVQRRDGSEIYNSLVVLDGSGAITETYDKHHLVPFGEYVPRAGLLGIVTRTFSFLDERGSYARGAGPALVAIPGLGVALPLICYEAIFPQDVSAAPGRPEFLLQITNDAWFGTFQGPYQHMAQARFRAVEQGLPMVRVANTGVSAMIDAGGRILAQIPLGIAGYEDAALPPAGKPTIYSQTGDWPAIVAAIALLALAAARRTIRD